MDSYRVLKHPVMSERSEAFSREQKYIFFVDKDANKIDIRKAVESLYDVRVIKVNVLYKPKRMKMVRGKKVTLSAKKKAIVTLRKEDKIDIF